MRYNKNKMNEFSKMIISVLVSILLVFGLAILAANYLNLGFGGQTAQNEPRVYSAQEQKAIMAAMEAIPDRLYTPDEEQAIVAAMKQVPDRLYTPAEQAAILKVSKK